MNESPTEMIEPLGAHEKAEFIEHPDATFGQEPADSVSRRDGEEDRGPADGRDEAQDRSPDEDSSPALLHRVLVDGEMFFRKEGDYLLDQDELAVYDQQQSERRSQADQSSGLTDLRGFGEAAITTPTLKGSALVGIQRDNKILRWAPGTILTYCILQQTFARRDWYEQVVENMHAATADWEATCGVVFEHRRDADQSGSVRPPNVIFPVRQIDAGGAFIAAAFFPNDPPARRRLLIDPSYFKTSFDRVGVLRHELGHTLGFRHEQLRPEAPPTCPDEDPTGTVDLTVYDPKSVMHYFCGNVGSRDLRITDVDRTGAQILYGPPVNHFEFVSA